MFRTKVVEKIKTHILCSKKSFFFQKLCRIWSNVGKYLLAGQATHDNIQVIRCIRISYWVPKPTNTHSEYLILIGYTYLVCPVKVLYGPWRLLRAFPIQQSQFFFYSMLFTHEAERMLLVTDIKRTEANIKAKTYWETHCVRRVVYRLCQSVTQFVKTQNLFQTQTDYTQDVYQICEKCRLDCRTNRRREYNLGSLIVEIRP
jgi:hypothetical protein